MAIITFILLPGIFLFEILPKFLGADKGAFEIYTANGDTRNYVLFVLIFSISFWITLIGFIL